MASKPVRAACVPRSPERARRLHGVVRACICTLFTFAVFFSEAKLVYPYIPDWHAAVLIAAGSSFHTALAATGVVLLCSFLLLLLLLNVRLTGSTVAATLAVLLTLLCGGVGGFVWLFSDRSWSGLLR